MPSPVESFSVNSSCLSPATMYDFWRDCTSPLFSTQPLTDTVNYQGFITSYAAQGLVVTNVGFENQVICRTPEQVRRDGSDFLLLQYYQNGKQVGYLDNGFPLENHSGVITLQDYAHAYQSVGHSNNNYGILIPRNLIEYRNTIYENRPVVTWDSSSLNGTRLLGSIKVFFGQLAQENALQNIHLARDHLVTVVNQHLGSLFKEQSTFVSESELLELIKLYIWQNLSNTTLSVDHLIGKFNLSRATLYRLFKDEGGVKKFIQQERLQRCYYSLAYISPVYPQSITCQAIAAQWGFNNYASFNRLFRQQYGFSPTEIARTPLLPALNAVSFYSPSDTTWVNQFHQWVA